MPHCLSCGRETKKDTPRCRSCAMRDRWKRPDEREKFTEHNRELLKLNWENPEFRELQSKLCKERSELLISSRSEESNRRLASSVKSSWERDYDRRVSINRKSLESIRWKPTSGELAVLEFLDTLEVDYIYQYEVKRSVLGLKGPGRGKILDFYLPEYRLDIEIDGSSHSVMMGRESDDASRDELLNSLGYIVKRIKDNGDREGIKSSLFSILEEVGYEYRRYDN